MTKPNFIHSFFNGCKRSLADAVRANKIKLIITFMLVLVAISTGVFVAIKCHYNFSLGRHQVRHFSSAASRLLSISHFSRGFRFRQFYIRLLARFSFTGAIFLGSTSHSFSSFMASGHFSARFSSFCRANFSRFLP